MSAEEAYRQKQLFLQATEKSLRRRLSVAEKQLLTLVFERIINRMELGGDGTIRSSVQNQNLLNTFSRVHREYTKPANIAITKEFARSVMKLPMYGGRYFGKVSEAAAGRIAEVRANAESMLRAKLGLTDSMEVKAGGYIQTLVEDVTVRNRLRSIISRTIEEGGHTDTLRLRVRDYLVGSGQGALVKQAEGQLFDTMMDADRYSDYTMAIPLGLQGAVYVGGLIETTRTICCQLDTKAWTRDEMEALNERARNGRPWGGYKGDIEIHCGGWNCRHGWRWVGNSALLRMRKDLEIVPGTKLVRPVMGVAPQKVNEPCGKRKG